MDAHVSPEGTLDFLSQREILKLRDASEGGLYDLFRRCALAVLNSGSKTDNTKEILEQHQNFEIRLVPQAFGVKLEVRNAPDSAFVDGRSSSFCVYSFTSSFNGNHRNVQVIKEWIKKP